VISVVSSLSCTGNERVIETLVTREQDRKEEEMPCAPILLVAVATAAAAAECKEFC
jgi:hypothetical protein